MNFRKIDLIGLLWIAVFMPDIAEGQQKHFRKWSVKDGLSQSLVYNITQDKQGYLWLGTYGGGICRFDGKNFKVFSLREGLADNKIRVLKTGQQGRLWIGTENAGLICFDGKDFETKLGKEQGAVRSLLIDRKNRKWIGTVNGLFLMDDRDTIHHVQSIETQVNAIFQNSEGNIFIGLGSGKIIKISEPISSKELKVTKFLAGKEPLSLLTLDNKDRLWLASGKNMLLFDKNGESVSHLEIEKKKLKHKPISAFCDSKGQIWIGTEGGGVWRVYEDEMENLTEKNGLGSNIIAAFYEDDRGNIWLGTEGGGFSRYHVSPFTFYTTDDGLSNNKITAVTTDLQGKIYIGTLGDGITVLDEKMVYRHPKVTAGFIMSLHGDAEGNVWAGTIGEGVFKINENKVVHYGKSDGFGDGRVMQIYEASDGALWFAEAGRGLAKYKEGKFRFFTEEDGLISNEIFAIAEDDSGNMLFGSINAGLIHFDGRQFTKMQQGELDKKRILSLSPMHNMIWMGTDGNGLHCFWNDRVYSFSSRDGLSSDNIYLTLPDGDGNLWIGTEKGLDKLVLDQTQDEISIQNTTQYKLGDGMQAIEANLNAAVRDASGNLWFGTVEGLVKYDPAVETENIKPPVTLLGNLKVFQEDINWNSEMNPAFNYDQNHLTFEYIGISFEMPEQVRYQFKLEPIEKSWSPVTGETHATYSSLPPGDYVFKVTSFYDVKQKAASEPVVYSFSIASPFWKTGWFYGSVTVFLTLMIILIIKWREYESKKREKKLQKEVGARTKELLRKNEELEKARETAEQARKAEEQFIANVSHEMRTPMNAIIGLANLMKDAGLPEKQKEYIQSIRFSAGNLLAMINDILDMSRMEEGKMEFQPKPFAFTLQIEELFRAMKVKAQEKELAFDLFIDDNIPETISGDPVRLSQILMNLLDNAIKFTEKGGVRLEINKIDKSDEKRWLEFKISDSGIGIPEELKETVFERFKQVNPDKQQSGSGLGLAIVKKITALQGGIITLDSIPGKGTVFTVELPFDSPKTDSKAEISPNEQNTIKNSWAKVLLVEDNELNRMVLEGFLQKWELHQYELAFNGQQAVELHKKNNYDLILMDVNMPVMDGYEATKIIRTMNADLAKVPIIAITAFFTGKDKEKCLRAGMNDYIAKPFEPGELYEKINRFIGGVSPSASSLTPRSTPGSDQPENRVQPAEKIVDLSLLQNLNNTEAMNKIITIFIENTPVDIEKLKKYYAAEDWNGLGRTAHNLQSNVQYIGIKQLQQDIRQIGAYAGKNEMNDKIPELISKIKTTCEQAIEELCQTFNK